LTVACVVAAIAIAAWSSVELRRRAIAAWEREARAGAIGRYVGAHLPSAVVMAARADAADIMRASRGTVVVAPSDEAGELFEDLEAMPDDARPTHLALAAPCEFAGQLVIRERDLALHVADFDHARSAERPLAPHVGWAIVDRVDVADRASERAHGWIGSVEGPSIVAREIGASGLAIDGGRPVRGERFAVAIDPAKPVRVIARVAAPVRTPLDLGALGSMIVPISARFVEVELALPSRGTATLEVNVRAASTYRIFHWFVLQPE
jgi:hypothetical protein